MTDPAHALDPDDDELDLLTDHEKERLKHQAIADRNLRRERARRATKNRRRGLPEPKIGDFLHVAIARGISQRNRAGLIFERNKSTKVEVVDVEAEALADRQRTELVVDVAGAELLLEDDALIVRQSPAGDEDMLEARATIESHLAEIAKLRAELDLARGSAKKDARRAASAADNDVAPSRLAAAKAAGKKFDEGQQAGNLLPTGKFAGTGAPAPAPSAELGDFIVPDKG